MKFSLIINMKIKCIVVVVMFLFVTTKITRDIERYTVDVLIKCCAEIIFVKICLTIITIDG